MPSLWQATWRSGNTVSSLSAPKIFARLLSVSAMLCLWPTFHRSKYSMALQVKSCNMGRRARGVRNVGSIRSEIISGACQYRFGFAPGPGDQALSSRTSYRNQWLMYITNADQDHMSDLQGLWDAASMFPFVHRNPSPPVEALWTGQSRGRPTHQGRPTLSTSCRNPFRKS